MFNRQANQTRFTVTQIALWLTGFILITGNGTLLFLELSHWLQNEWLKSLRHLALPIGLLCFWLMRSRRLFGQEAPQRTDVAALLQRQGAQQAMRTALPVALAFAFGAWLGKVDVPLIPLLFTGLWVTGAIYVGTGMWLTRRGAPLPEPPRDLGLTNASPGSPG